MEKSLIEKEFKSDRYPDVKMEILKWPMLVIRLDENYPLGVFHLHSEGHNIKKENIGLIEVWNLLFYLEKKAYGMDKRNFIYKQRDSCIMFFQNKYK